MAWDWAVLCENTMDHSLEASCWASNGGTTYLQWMIDAWGWTLSVTGVAWLIAMFAGVIIGTLRSQADRPLITLLAGVWIELFRNIPILVQLFIWYFVLPAVFPVLLRVPGFVMVVLGLGFFTSARIAEQVRAGIQALPRGQRNAGLAMGFTTFQTYRYILLPIALRIILPPLTSESMNLLKNSSAAFAVSIPELTMFAMQAQEETSRGTEIYLAVTLLYALSAFTINRLFAVLEKKVSVPGYITTNDTGGGH